MEDAGRHGVLIFDDYLWRYFRHDRSNPAVSINLFLRQKRDEYQLIRVDSQVVVQRLTDEADRHALR